MFHLVFWLTVFPFVYAGTECGPRAQIYPCICIHEKIGKKYDTTVICPGLRDGSSITGIEEALSNMDINKFLLYDSFWETADPRNLNIPVNTFTAFKIEEIQIVDTALSPFGCPEKYNCRTNYLKRFSVINSTLSERPSCENKGFTIIAWISCPDNVEQLTIDKGFSNDVNLKPDFFPIPMPKLKTLNMPRNHISRIDRRTFSLSKFPALQTLDLSHNSLRDARMLFSSVLTLKYLDLSFNSLRTISDFQYLPNLRTLKLANNDLTSLTPIEFNHIPANLRHIDLSNNDIECGCGIQFLNSTFHISTMLLGSCKSPPAVSGKKLRKASRFLIERCDGDGKIGLKRKVSRKAE